jgi:hypothetical protein
MTDTPKTEYASPRLEVLGSFEKLTQSTGFGTKLDAAFPAGTPKVDLTFS